MEISDAFLQPYVTALASDDAEGQLIRLVIQFKESGGTQKQAEEMLHQLRVRTGAYEAVDTRDDLICEILDCVTGWCCGGNHIFAEDFDERRFYRTIPGLA